METGQAPTEDCEVEFLKILRDKKRYQEQIEVSNLSHLENKKN